MIKIEIKASDILEYMKDGEDCKIEIDGAGAGYIMPAEAYGFEDTILTQVIEAYHLEELESEADFFIGWLADAYEGVELEATGGQVITIEIN